MIYTEQDVDFELDVSVKIEARMCRNDYGVERSPVWYEADHHAFAGISVNIAGVDVLIKDMPIELRSAILERAIEACDDDKWSKYE